MSKQQRIGLAMFLLGLVGMAISISAWPLQLSMLFLGYLMFVSDDFGRRVLLTLFRALWLAGWLYRRARGIPEPKRS